MSAVSVLLSTRLIVTHFGRDGFALYALVSLLPLLVPAADLGMGAVVTDVVARRALLTRDQVDQVIRRALRRVAIAGAVVALAAVLMDLLGIWSPVLGLNTGLNEGAAAAAALAVFGASMPVVLALRVLQGLERNHLATLIQVFGAVTSLAVVYATTAQGWSIALTCTAPSAANIVVGAIGWVLARRMLARERFSTGAHENDLHGIGMRATSAVVILIALPIAFQTDRLVLSHVLGVGSVAVYSAGSQLFVPFLSLLAASGQSMWPIFTRQHAEGSKIAERDFLRLTGVFLLGGVACGLFLVTCGPPLTSWVTQGRVTAGSFVMLAFALLLLATCGQTPVGMSLMDSRGARFQAKTCVLMSLVNVPLSIVLAHWIGTPGPLLSSAVCIVAIQTIPSYVVLRPRLIT